MKMTSTSPLFFWVSKVVSVRSLRLKVPTPQYSVVGTESGGRLQSTDCGFGCRRDNYLRMFFVLEGDVVNPTVEIWVGRYRILIEGIVMVFDVVKWVQSGPLERWQLMKSQHLGICDHFLSCNGKGLLG